MPKKKALLIGISYQGQEDELQCTVADVALVTNMLTSIFDYPVEKDTFRILSDISLNLGEADLRNATEKDILEGVKWLMDDCQPNDYRFMYFSGHGKQMLDKNFDEKDLYDEAIVSSDGVWIRDDDLFELLPKKVPFAARLTAVIDCDHSGTMLDLPITPREHHQNYFLMNLKEMIRKTLYNDEPRKLESNIGKTFLISAGTDRDIVRHVEDDSEVLVSKFTNNFVQLIQTDGMKGTSYEEFLNQLEKQFTYEKQTPQISISHDLDLNDEIVEI